MTRIAVAGAAGRMGRRICALCSEYDLELTGAFEHKDHPDIGKDLGRTIGADIKGINIASSIEDVIEGCDAVMDFTSPEATLFNMNAAATAGKAYVTGTTGIDRKGQDRIRELASKIPCVYAGNMSLGINLLTKVVADIARALGDGYDVEVVEAHHKMKKDAPSGTAYMLAGSVAEALGRDIEKDGVFSRHGMIGERSKTEIGVQTIRGGDIVGEHTVMFIGMGERIEVAHRISTRDALARGALKAAEWIKGRPAGLYDMQDVLGLK